MGNGETIAPYMNERAAHALGTTLQECEQIPSCSAGLFGVDFTQEKSSSLIDRWYAAARDPDAFFSPRADQNALSIILHQQNCREMAPLRTLIDVELGQPTPEDALFLIDRGFVHKKFKLPKSKNI